MTTNTSFEDQVESLRTTELSNDNIYKVLKLKELPAAEALRYLKIYVDDIPDWEQALAAKFVKLNGNKELMREQISATILLPAVDRSIAKKIAAHQLGAKELLASVGAFDQFKERKDWFNLFSNVYEKDIDIDNKRSTILAEGIIHPIDYVPYSRQAFNWLYEKAEETGCIKTEQDKLNISNRFTHLVQVYGGAIICNIFTRHSQTIPNIVNWRTGYFFERNIHQVYNLDEMIKIKRAELQKTNKNLVKSIKII